MNPLDFSRADTLRNGLAITIRALRPEDRKRVAAAVGKLDRESVYTRLFSYWRGLTEAGLDRIMTFDADREIALVVTTPIGGEEIVIGGGRYIASGGEGSAKTAEVAFIVEEDYHGLGIASRLLRELAAIARPRGILTFEADVLEGNKAMLNVFARSGMAMRQLREGGTLHVTLSL